MEGKVIVITGGNAGIGYATAVEAVKQRAARVIIVGRDAARVGAAAAALGPTAVGEVADVSSLASVDAFVARATATYPRIDILVCNAGTFVPPHSKTPEGFEVTLGTNVIGCAALTYGLLPLVVASPSARIIVLSSAMVHRSSASAIAARFADVGGARAASTTVAIYAESKVIVTLWAAALQRALRATPAAAHVLVASCDPGTVDSGIQNKTQGGCFGAVLRFGFPLVAKTPALGAVPVVFCATAADVAAHGGATWTEGPRVRLLALKSYFNDANRDAAFKAVNAAIEGTGRKSFFLEK